MQFKNLQRYGRGQQGHTMNLSIPLPKTVGGRVYRYSPNENAPPRHFVLGNAATDVSVTPEKMARMKLAPRSSQTVCPYSGVVADDREFTHPDDIDAAKELVKHAAVADVTAELKRMADSFNRGQSRNSLIKLGMSITTPSRRQPRFFRRDLLRDLVCDHCGREYGVYAIALFCPDCGAPNLRLHFRREEELVSAQVDLADGLPDDRQELAYRLLGNAHEDVLTAFEATLKTMYAFVKRAADPGAVMPKIGNEFQNVERGQRRFVEVGMDPFVILDSGERETLDLNIQKRHLIGHNLGVVDQRFADQSASARIGETVHLVGTDIRSFAAICLKVIDGLDAWLGGSDPPPPSSDSAAQGPRLPVSTLMHGQDATPRLADELGLSDLAVRVAHHLAETSETGRTGPIDDDRLLAAFVGEAERDVGEALAELSADGYVRTTSMIGLRLPRVAVEVGLFATFDPVVMGHDPTKDAAHLAERALEAEQTIDVASLNESTGWRLRRFNPALSILIAQIDERRVSRVGDLTYPTRHFFLDPEDRGALKRFIASVHGN